MITILTNPAGAAGMPYAQEEIHDRKQTWRGCCKRYTQAHLQRVAHVAGAVSERVPEMVRRDIQGDSAMTMHAG
jgi:hypothetical protein